MRFLLGLAALALLPACMRSDLTLDFRSPEVVVARSSVDLPPAMLEAFGAGSGRLCGAGEAVEGSHGLTCHGSRQNEVSRLVTGQVDFGGFGGEVDVSGIVTTELLSRDRLRVSVDMAALVRAVQAVDPARFGALLPAQARYDGDEGLVLRIRGGEIIGTTGQLSADGREARVFIRAARFQEADPDFGGPFITLLKFQGECLFDFFCD